MSKNVRPAVLITCAVILMLGTAIIYFGYSWFLHRQERVLVGTARPTFPYSDYNLEELNKLYPQYLNENVKTTQTPEETHRKFITALKAGDLNGAVECCFRPGDWDKMKKSLEEIKKQGYLDEMVKDLGEIKPDVVGDNRSTFSYSVLRDEKLFKEYLSYVKNGHGVWLIESL